MADALWIALASGLALAAMSGPLGCIIVWRRMAYFGDAMAHAALLGVALSLLSKTLPLTVLVFLVSVAAALLLRSLTSNARLHADTALGMIAHSALAIGIVLISLFGDASLELESYLIGDILSMSWQQAGSMWAAAIVICSLCAYYWRHMVMVVLDNATARLHGVPVAWVEMFMVLSMAVVVALAIQLVGVLLLTAMLIIPAATAGNMARAPGRMAVMASAIGGCSVALGLYASVLLDTPPAPTMVATATLLFMVSRLFYRA